MPLWGYTVVLDVEPPQLRGPDRAGACAVSVRSEREGYNRRGLHPRIRAPDPGSTPIAL